MSQIPNENEDNRSVAASDFVQLDHPDEVPGQEEQQPQFGFQQNPLDWTMDTGSSSNYGNELKELKLMVANLEVFLQGIIDSYCNGNVFQINYFQSRNQALQAKVEKVEFMAKKALENLELKAENRALKENAEQKANYQVYPVFISN
jgi:hypothetical protein